MIIDCFLFFRELRLLEIRLEYLYDLVDKFVIVEAIESFTGEYKGFIFEAPKYYSFASTRDRTFVNNIYNT